MARKRQSRLELAAKYEKWADETRRWDATTPGLREDRLQLAIGWHELAVEIEPSLANVPAP
jgi:hypothetical protein